MKSLVVVESPAKAKTIEKFLGKDFKVVASYGHVRDLPKSELGIDVDKDFNPKYIIPTKARKRLNALKKEVADAKDLYLATDLDREGEAIAWHIVQAVGLNEVKSKNEKLKNVHRITFSEITKNAIQESLKNPREININLVDAQQARRILDRLVGYNLSPLLWKKIRRGLSAGRVQSVALRLIIEREREIEAFKPQEYWQIEALLSKEEKEKTFTSKLFEKDGKRLEKLEIKSEKEALKIKEDLKNAPFVVRKVEKKTKIRNPYPPFTTSTLQQEASRKLGFSAKKTMVLAQQLYEGIELGKEGSVGLITYMRTDSLNLSEDFIKQALDIIEQEFGSNYKKAEGRRFKTKAKTAQEAHEAIRPTYPKRSPETIKGFLALDQLKLYSLIYNRALASQMAEAVFDTTRAEIEALNYGFLATGQSLKFDGFLKIYKGLGEETILPDLKETEKVNLVNLNPVQSFTEPKARYSEASLVKTLEENGIGRPSTYAPIMSTIQDRGYVKKEKGFFIPQEIGYIVNDLLVSHFSDIVDVKFTAHVEEELDDIASGRTGRVKVLSEFYKPFHKNLEAKHEEIEKIKLPEVETDIKCEKCGKPMVIKIGRFGKFLACTGFPECKNTKAITKEVKAKCPRCGEKLLERKTRKGRTFYGCSGYPGCNFATWEEPIEKQCEKCGSLLVKDKKGNIRCIDCSFRIENSK